MRWCGTRTGVKRVLKRSGLLLPGSHDISGFGGLEVLAYFMAWKPRRGVDSEALGKKDGGGVKTSLQKNRAA